MSLTLTAFLCLSLNVYKEARGEQPHDQQAIALVTLNRAKNRKMSVCQVVYQDRQFSWTITDTILGKILPDKMPDITSWEWKRAVKSAYQSLSMKDFTHGATHYHTIHVHPYWDKNMKYIGQYGNHVLYKKRREFR